MAKQNVKTESWVENYFQLQQHGTTVKTEVIAGLTTFFTMAYIIVVNPGIISMGDGQIYNGVFFATCISAFIGTALMAFLAKIPFAQAPGMGLNAFFAFTVMPAMIKITGKDLTIIEQYQCALALVFMSGLLFILITVIGAREA
ncbi:MAG: solute carrier family 23 protein, partial [Hydrogenoanaerobacterium sp.]